MFWNRTILLLITIICWCSYPRHAFAEKNKNAETENVQPNILFIAIDDLRPELGCYGAKHIISPNIDRLAREGIIFDRAYCQMAICMASRKSIMSGYRPSAENNLHDRGPLIDNISDVLTLDQHLLQNGYETVTIGKIYHDEKDEKDWSQNYRSISGNWGSKGYVEKTSINIDKKRNSLGKKGPPYESADVDDNEYQTGAFAQKAIEVLRNKKDKPLFLALGFRKPHLPFNAPKKYWDMYDPENIKLAAHTHPPEGASEYNRTRFGELRNYYGMPAEGLVSQADAIKLTHGYYACTSYVDAQLGKVLAELENLGYSENTIIVLWSDHGWKLGDYGWWCKHTTNEIDTRVPFIIKVPNVKGNGTRSTALVELIDVYPTLCDLAGITTPIHNEGLSLVPLLSEPNRDWKKAAFSIWVDRNPKYIGHTLRSDQYRYTEWRDMKTGNLLDRELYDLSAGSLPKANLARLRKNKKLVSEFSQIMEGGYQSALPD
jgi:iduronate 2-sulfatase